MMGLFLPGLEALLNRYLRLDPDTIKRIAKLQGKTIEINISDWNITFFIAPTQDGLQLNTQTPQTPDCIIHGKLFDLIQSVQSNQKKARLSQRKIFIRGDIHIAEALQEILKRMDIDWEEHFSHYLGDSLAHKSVSLLKQAQNLVSRSLNLFKENFRDFIHEEAELSPTPEIVEDMYQKISTLRDDTERLEARVQRLFMTVKEHK
jgi:ubiquinone biosynthesis protein UbiJ